MAAALDLRILLVPQVTSVELTVLPLHLPVMSRSQHKASEAPMMEAALLLGCFPGLQLCAEQVVSQQAASLVPAMAAALDLRILLVPQVTSVELTVLPLHLPVMSLSQHDASVAAKITFALLLRCLPGEHE